MTDTIIKGSGNSRTIKSVPNLAALAPTYDKLLELLTGQGLPVDIGALNPSGLQQRGTDLNKENLLKDATAALYSKGADATVDQVLAAIKPMIDATQSVANSKAKIAAGSYMGTGKHGESNPNSLTFPFAPKFVIMLSSIYNTSTGKKIPQRPFYGQSSSSFAHYWMVPCVMLTTEWTAELGFGIYSSPDWKEPYGKKSPDGKTIYWYQPTSDMHQYNQIDYSYYFVAIG